MRTTTAGKAKQGNLKEETIMRKLIYCLTLILLTVGASMAQVAQQNTKPYYLLPDLAFTKVTKKSESTIVVVVINLGKVKSPSAKGAFGCESIEPDASGIKIGFSGLLAIKALAPGAVHSFSFSCGNGNRVLGASLDGNKQIKESNENNNTITF